MLKPCDLDTCPDIDQKEKLMIDISQRIQKVKGEYLKAKQENSELKDKMLQASVEKEAAVVQLVGVEGVNWV